MVVPVFLASMLLLGRGAVAGAAPPAGGTPTPLACTTAAVETAVDDGGSYLFDCAGTIDVPQLDVTTAVSLDATGHTVILYGQSLNRVFDVEGGSLSLTHVEVSGGVTTSGPAPATGTNGTDGTPGVAGAAGPTPDGGAGSAGTDGTAGTNGTNGGNADGSAQGGGIYVAGGTTVTLDGVIIANSYAYGDSGGSGGNGGNGGAGGAGGAGGCTLYPAGCHIWPGGAGGDGSPGGPGGSGGNGADAAGGGMYVSAGATLVATNVKFLGDAASAGSGGTGGNGGNGGAGGGGGYGSGPWPSGGIGAAGGNAGEGGAGGNAYGGGLYNDGTATLTSVTFSEDSVSGGYGTSGSGGAGGNAGGAALDIYSDPGGPGGPGGNGASGTQGQNGGTAEGGGLYDGGTVTWAGGSVSADSAYGGGGGNGGNGSNGGGAGGDGALAVGGPPGAGGSGGSGGDGGDASGGAVFPATTTASGVTCSANVVQAGLGGPGGTAGTAGALNGSAVGPGANGSAGQDGADGDTAYANPSSCGLPTVSSITPDNGPLTGGNTVTIHGSGFVSGGVNFSGVNFVPVTNSQLGVASTSAVVDSDTEITVVAPSMTAAAGVGSVVKAQIQVQFINPVGSVTSTAAPQTLGADSYVFGAPQITSISPPAGPLAGGDQITITGSGFQTPGLDLVGVGFQGDVSPTVLDGVDPTVVSDTEITVVTPDATALAAGADELITTVSAAFSDVFQPGETVNAKPTAKGDDRFIYGTPVISSIDPAGGPLAGANTITITGTGFNADGLTITQVSFDPGGGVAPLTGFSPTVVSDTELTVEVPDATTAAAGLATLPATVTAEFTDANQAGATVSSVPASSGADNYTFGAPVIDSITPVAGPLAGGTSLTITGSGFEDPSLAFDKLTFDPTDDTQGSRIVDGTSATVVSDTEITVTTPSMINDAGGTGSVVATVGADFTTSDATIVQAVTSAGSSSRFSFGVPVVDSVAPAAGPLIGGDPITITGSGFAGPGLTLTSVQFTAAGGTVLDGVNPVVASDTQLTVTTPDALAAASGRTTLQATVTAVFANGSSTIDSIVGGSGDNGYQFGVPVVDAVSPTAGPLAGGNELTITGSGFTSEGLTLSSVIFTPSGVGGGASTPLTGVADVVDSDTQITVFTPDATAAADGASSLATAVTLEFDDPAAPGVPVDSAPAAAGDDDYTFADPTITSVSPAAGALSGGNTVTITGENFDVLDLAGVAFDPLTDTTGTAAIVGTGAKVVSDTEITVVAPDATSAASPASTLATLAQVTFDNPADPSTPIEATTSDGGSASYDFGTPLVSAVSPDVGVQDGGATITITGSGFQNPALTLSSVGFVTSGATPTTVDGTSPSVVSDTAITVTTPDVTTAADGSADLATTVVVTFEDPGDGGATVTSVLAPTGADTFTFTSPAITSISPDRGPLGGGNTVTITGTGFADLGLTLQSVSFTPTGSGGGALTATNFTVVSDTEITVQAPDATAAAGPSGTVDATVTADFTDPADANAAEPSDPTTVGDNTYTFGVPTMDSLAPANGPLSGGNTLTITGSGFQEPGLTLSGVDFTPNGTSGAPALNGTKATVVSDTQITVTVPDATTAAGTDATLTGTVTAEFSGGGGADIPSAPEATGDDQYTWATPAISSVAPASGPLAGGTTVTVTGTGFQDLGLTTPTVTFTPTAGGAGLDGTGATVVSDTELTVVTPDATAAAGAGTSSLDTTVTVSFVNPDNTADPVLATVASGGGDAFLFGTPLITSVAPSAGPLTGGTTVTITGSGFQDPGLSFTGVTFDPAGGGQATPLSGGSATVLSDTEITVVTPDATTAAGTEATLATTVTAVFDNRQTPGESVLTVPAAAGDNGYDFGVPLVNSVAPVDGGVTGGTTVTITGSGFEDPSLTLASVDFQPSGTANPAAILTGVDPTVVSDTEITVTTPDAVGAASGSATLDSTVQVTFDGPGGATVDAQESGAGDFAFESPAIDAVTPSSGPADGGNQVTITGQGFEGHDLSLTGVTFVPTGASGPAGGLAGTNATVVSDTEITVSAPDASAVDDGSDPLDATVVAAFADSGDAGTTLSAPPAAAGDDAYAFDPPTTTTTGTSSTPGVVSSPGGTVDVTGSGFAAGESVDVSVHSTPVLLKTVTASDSGGIDTTVTLPTDLADGAHQFILVGVTSGHTTTIPLTVVPPGLRLVGSDGGVFSFGGASAFGSEGGRQLASPVVGMAPTSDGQGYWLVAADGGVFAFGDAPFLGSEGGRKLVSPVVGMAATGDGRGYWLVAADGGVFAFGDAPFLGSEGGRKLAWPVVGVTASADGQGYWLVAADGGVFSFGDAPFPGSMAGRTLNGRIVGTGTV